MKAVIFGMGSIGRRQADILTRRGVDVIAFRSGFGPAEPSGLDEIRTWDQFSDFAPDFSVICTPTDLHSIIALNCALRGSHLFIEKPIDASVNSVLGCLLQTVGRKNLTAYVAYPLRFHPEIKKLKPISPTFYLPQITAMTHLPSWHPSRRLEDTYSYRRSTGGGALLELSHEIDLAEYLFGEIIDIECHAGRMGGVTLDAEDYAILETTHDSGQICCMLLDIGAHKDERFIEWWGNESGGYKRVDYSATTECYEAQMDYFLENLDNPQLMNNLAGASKLFRKTIKVRDEIH